MGEKPHAVGVDMPPKKLPTLMTLAEVAKYFGVTYETALEWAKNGALPVIRVNRRYRIPAEELVKRLRTGRIQMRPARRQKVGAGR